MFLRFFVYAYFPLISIGLYLSDKYNFQFARGMVYIIAGMYVFIRIVNGFKRKIQKYSNSIDVGVVLLYSYVVLYSLLYFPRSTTSVLGAVSLTPILLIHTLFWDFLFTSSLYKTDRNRFFFDLFLSVLFGTLFLFISSFYYTNFSLIPGSIHNIAEEWIMVSSDLDVPLLLLIVFAFIITQFKIKNKIKMIKVPIAYIVLLIVFSIFLFWLYARRGPIVALAGLIVFVFIPSKHRNKVFALFSFFPFIPMFWDIVSDYLLKISQTDFVSSFLARNNANDYLTATDRMVDWVRGISFLFDFKLKHFIGYGGPPWFVVTEGRDHMHNLVLTLVFDSGIIVFLLFSILFVFLIKMMKNISSNLKNKIWGVEALFLILFVYLLFSPIEPMLHSHSYQHLLFLTTSIIIIRLNQFVNVNKLD